MHEVQTFLREAWEATECTVAANNAERLRQERARHEGVVRAKKRDFNWGEWLGWAWHASVSAYLIGSLGGCAFRVFDESWRTHGVSYPFDAFVSVGLVWGVLAGAVVLVIALMKYSSIGAEESDTGER